MNKFSVVQIARICHQANKAYCESLGDFSQEDWDYAKDWQRESAINGVEFQMGSYREPKDSHENWRAHKLAEGWKYGPVKNAELKEHPCMVPFEELSKEQQMKDIIFTSICSSFMFSGL